MAETLQKWLDELQEELLLVPSGDVNTQAIANMWTFGLTEKNFRDPCSVVAFVEELRNLYASKNSGGSMLFYIWHDEMAGQLRASAVSAEYELPFRCKINPCEISDVLNTFVETDDGESPQASGLRVWVSRI